MLPEIPYQDTPVGKRAINIMLCFFVVLALADIYFIYEFFPQNLNTKSELDAAKIEEVVKGTISLDSAQNISSIDTGKLAQDLEKMVAQSEAHWQPSLLPRCKKIGIELQILILVALSGLLGSLIYIISSFINFLGNKTFEKSWIWFYLAKPVVGTLLAILVYFVFRAGFFSGSIDPNSLNLFGILTFAGLAGLFSDDATLKLKEVFDVIFKAKDDRAGKLQGDDKTKPASDTRPPAATAIAPLEITRGQKSQVIITGENFTDKLEVKCDGLIQSNVKFENDTLTFDLELTDASANNTDIKVDLYDPESDQTYPAGVIKIIPSAS